jgi:hypothetical protein
MRVIKRPPMASDAIVSNNIVSDTFYDVIFVNYIDKNNAKNTLEIDKQIFLSENLKQIVLNRSKKVKNLI